MEVLIKIPDKYVSEDKSIYEMLLSMGKDKVKGAVKLLPKGHGKLIDADKLEDEAFKCCGMVVVDYMSIQLAPTIVEADKGD